MTNAFMILHGNAGFSCRNPAESLAFIVLYRDSTVAIPAAQWNRSRMVSKGFWLNLTFFRLLCEAGIGVCTAEAPFDSAQDRRRAQRKEFLIINTPDSMNSCPVEYRAAIPQGECLCGEYLFIGNPEEPI